MTIVAIYCTHTYFHFFNKPMPIYVSIIIIIIIIIIITKSIQIVNHYQAPSAFS